MYNQGFREATLVLYKYLKNMKKTAKALNIGIGTVWRWINNGITPLKRHPSEIPEVLKSFVKLKLEGNNSLTQTELKKLVLEHLQVNISRHCISTIIRLLGLSRKRLRKRGLTNKVKYEERMTLFKKGLETSTEILSIDEIGFDQRMVPLYGYSQIGTKAIGFTHPTNRKRTNVIMAIDSFGRKYYKAITGSVSAKEFNSFIQELPWKKGTTLIMDNVSFHKTEIVKQSMNEKGFKSLFIPPYTPECNPIENVFSVIKNNYRKRSIDLSLLQSNTIKESIDKIDHSMFQRCFNRMYSFVEKELIKIKKLKTI